MIDPVAEFERARPLLEGIAYRMLGGLAEAQDVVQDSYLRWRDADHAAIRDPRAWLVTVCTRLATTALTSARARREHYVGTWLPEPVATQASAEASVAADQSVSLAFVLVLEMLTPLERAAFLLHDVFDYPFDDIAQILGRAPEACRKLASRARARVRIHRPRPPAHTDDHARVVAAFAAALRDGDVHRIEQLLTASTRLSADGGGATSASGPLEGAAAIARLFARIFAMFQRTGVRWNAEPRWFNGALGVVVFEDDRLATAIELEVSQGAIERILAQRNPDKLASLRANQNPWKDGNQLAGSSWPWLR